MSRPTLGFLSGTTARKPRWVAILVALACLAPTAIAEDGSTSFSHVHVMALAVEQTPQGFVGVHADVDATALAGGSGRVYVSTKPLAQADMQGSARLAAQVAAATLSVDWRNQDYLVSFTSNSTVIGGPRAGAVMTLALTTALHNLLNPQSQWTLDPSVAGTGTINPDGTIGPVGGIPAKAEGAAQAGIKTFLYPAGLDNATTLTAQGTVTVNMATHCQTLGITCRPAATIADLVGAAAHVSFLLPAIPVPDTTGYAAALSPGVQTQLDALKARLAGIPNRTGYAQLSSSANRQVAAAQSQAQRDLDAAQGAFTAGHYYSSATSAFQGAIAAGYAENLVDFYSKSQAEGVVTAAITKCQGAVQQAQATTASSSASTLNALYAMGAAQERAQEANTTLLEAQSSHDNANTYTDWMQSLQQSSFCVERAGTVAWWAGLTTVFPGGPKVDAADLAQQAIDQATELASYAQNVLDPSNTGSSDPVLRQAQSKLAQAVLDQQAGRSAAAAVEAAETQTLASAAVQLGGGTTVPASVLVAAQQAAARAIARARTQGAEPVLSVSLVELAQGQTDPATSLQDYWDARNLALLDLLPAGSPMATTQVTGNPLGGSLGGQPPRAGNAGNPSLVASQSMVSLGGLLLALVMGMLCGGTLVALVVQRRRASPSPSLLVERNAYSQSTGTRDATGQTSGHPDWTAEGSAVPDSELNWEPVSPPSRFLGEPVEPSLAQAASTDESPDPWLVGPLPVRAVRDWSLLTVMQLRDELRSRGLAVGGKKEELAARLSGDDAIRPGSLDSGPSR
jgi:uncharacterized protein